MSNHKQQNDNNEEAVDKIMTPSNDGAARQEDEASSPRKDEREEEGSQQWGREERHYTKESGKTLPLFLPSDFEPSSYSVIFGRSRKCTEAVGNRRLKVIATLYLDRYSKASKSRDKKSAIVTAIQSMVRSACPNPHGAFVRQATCSSTSNKSGTCNNSSDGKLVHRWVEVEDSVVRDKIGQVLRDCLHNKYRSSVKNKVVLRREKRIAIIKKSLESWATHVAAKGITTEPQHDVEKEAEKQQLVQEVELKKNQYPRPIPVLFVGRSMSIY